MKQGTSHPPVLAIDRLHVALPPGADRAYAVQDLSLSIAAGQTLCVVGESGSGKSVLATAVMGLLPRELKAAQGGIRLQGESLLEASALRLRQLRGRAMGMVFQEPMTALNPVMTCGRQIDELLRAHGQHHHHGSAAHRRKYVLDMLERVRLPEPGRMAASYPHQLSGGQRQRIVIAMALILKPALLICDEPTTALDVTTQKEILKLIAELQSNAAYDAPGALPSAVLFITHDMSVVADIADEVLVMHQGRAVEYGPVAEVMHTPRAAYTRMLLDAVPSLTPAAARAAPTGPALLRGEDLAMTYSRRNWLGRSLATPALHAAALAVRAGETVGVVGESGSGKSTLARCLIRLLEPSEGQVFWGDAEVAHLHEAALRPLRSQVQVVFQDPNRSLNPRRKVIDSIVEGAINFGASPVEALALAADLVHKLRLPPESLQRYPSQFSGGQRQRIALARALACRPKVLVADEAVSALDVSVQAQILELLRDIRDELGLGLLFITHDLRVAAQLCDRVLVMHQGRIVEQGITAELYARPQHPYTQRLLEAAPHKL